MERKMRKTDADEKRRVLSELLETAADLSAHGLLSKQQLAEMKVLCAPPPSYSPTKVQSIRVSKAKMSQAAFAAFLNVSVSSVQKWESPHSGKHPSGAAAKLLQLIENRGIDAVLA
jgi:putative transcriptional regulator